MFKKLLGWLFVPYIMIGVMLYKNNYKKTGLVIAGIPILFVLFLIIGISTADTSTVQHTEQEQSDKRLASPSPSVKPTIKLSVKPSVKPSVKKETLSQENAVKAAENYIRIMPFSKSGLVKQLKYEGYSTADATYAVDKLKIDYNKQAVKAAKNYLDTMAFSRSGLIKQLKYEGYTSKQATYGVDGAGL